MFRFVSTVSLLAWVLVFQPRPAMAVNSGDSKGKKAQSGMGASSPFFAAQQRLVRLGVQSWFMPATIALKVSGHILDIGNAASRRLLGGTPHKSKRHGKSETGLHLEDQQRVVESLISNAERGAAPAYCAKRALKLATRAIAHIDALLETRGSQANRNLGELQQIRGNLTAQVQKATRLQTEAANRAQAHATLKPATDTLQLFVRGKASVRQTAISITDGINQFVAIAKELGVQRDASSLGYLLARKAFGGRLWAALAAELNDARTANKGQDAAQDTIQAVQEVVKAVPSIGVQVPNQLSEAVAALDG